jgi:hypothetical protein
LTATGEVIAGRTAVETEIDKPPFGPIRIRLTVGILLTVAFVAFETLAVAMVLPAALAGWGAAGLGMGLAYSTLGLTMLEQADAGQKGDVSASLQFATLLEFVAASGLPLAARPPTLVS